MSSRGCLANAHTLTRCKHRMKANDVQFDDAIVECSWDPSAGPEIDGVRCAGWRLHRIRHDKHDGNHISIVHKIVRSIEDGVEEDEVSSAAMLCNESLLLTPTSAATCG